ncbi:hypothetical protein C2845_PM01G39690 [Panicum miliaceum]|uniref:Uncharacterized protein n=1 Tax=Panicum miliaceum TaxID=4540 RepID=A0A3L6TIX2_PANMI|nr:hypothetical protein C2845_PM01G39690 [Panicum miliaceum]
MLQIQLYNRIQYKILTAIFAPCSIFINSKRRILQHPKIITTTSSKNNYNIKYLPYLPIATYQNLCCNTNIVRYYCNMTIRCSPATTSFTPLQTSGGASHGRPLELLRRPARLAREKQSSSSGRCACCCLPAHLLAHEQQSCFWRMRAGQQLLLPLTAAGCRPVRCSRLGRHGLQFYLASKIMPDCLRLSRSRTCAWLARARLLVGALAGMHTCLRRSSRARRAAAACPMAGTQGRARGPSTRWPPQRRACGRQGLRPPPGAPPAADAGERRPAWGSGGRRSARSGARAHTAAGAARPWPSSSHEGGRERLVWMREERCTE